MKVGFARLDITPPLGSSFHYSPYNKRTVEGYLTPIYVNAVAFDDGDKKAAIVTLDIIGMPRDGAVAIKNAVSKATGIAPEAVFICCMHVHQGPGINNLITLTHSYTAMFLSRICDSVTLAIRDMQEATAYVAKGHAKELSYVRIYRMPDGTLKTNPGSGKSCLGPTDIADDEVQLVKFRREGYSDIAIVNFQTHADVISSDKNSSYKNMICHDYPGFVREILEKALSDEADGRGVNVMFINGAEGDVNHARRFDPETGMTVKFKTGFEYAKHMGRVLAGVVMGIYTYAKQVDSSRIFFKEIALPVPADKGTPEQIEMSKKVKQIHDEGGNEAVKKAMEAKEIDFDSAVANKYLMLMDKPDNIDIFVTCLGFGDVILIGFPGEPFNKIGRLTKEASPFASTLIACMANGSAGYFPTREIYLGGGYEASVSRFAVGTAELLAETAIELASEMNEINKINKL